MRVLMQTGYLNLITHNVHNYVHQYIYNNPHIKSNTNGKQLNIHEHRHENDVKGINEFHFRKCKLI